MISKIRKYQNSWFVKAILALTVLSFMSLFGISGYVGNAGKNRAVIKVDDMEILQDEMNVKLQNSIRKAQDMFGGNIEITEEISKNILSDLVKQNASNMIISRQAEKVNASISDELIKKIISSQPEFMNVNGQFDSAILHRQLAYFGLSENEYVNDLKQNVLSEHLVYSPVRKITFPKFMGKFLAKIANQQKVFQYIIINPAEMKIDRSITEEEVEQYYNDFAPQFEEVETRDIDFVELKINQLAKNMTISDDNIVAYYQDNIADFITPEKRNISQMVFDNEEIANTALERVKKGEDFYRVAKEVANQDKETTFLGELTADSMLPELSEKVFDAKSGEITDVIKTEFGWHILKVNNIIAKIETPLEKVKNKIISIIKDERSYDEAQNIISDIEDEIAQGSNLADIANKYDVKLYNIKKIKDDGSYVSSSAKKLKEILNSSDLIDTVFSYNENEVSQAIETEDGFIFAAVNKINEAHIKDLSVVRPEIIKIWTENEKSAIAQEIINDVLLNLDNGDSLSEIASRFNLKLKTTNPLKRGEEFGILNSIHTTEAYQIPDGDHKLFTISGNAMIISPVKTINNSAELTNKQLNDINKQMSKELEQNLSEELINSYAKDMDVRVKYRLLGLEN